jgi:hypothetical protein
MVKHLGIFHRAFKFALDNSLISNASTMNKSLEILSQHILEVAHRV